MKNYTIEVGPEQPNGGRIRRNISAADGILRVPTVDVHTLYDVFQYGVKKYPNNNVFGYRTLETMVEEEKEITKVIDGVETKIMKKWNYFQLSGYQYVTFSEANEMVYNIGAGFCFLGLQEKSKVEIFAPTNMYWLLTAHGLFSQNMTIVTAYDTLGVEGLLHSMNETEVEAIFTSAELLTTVLKVVGQCPSLQMVVYNGDAKPEHLDKFTQYNIKVLSIQEVMELGKQHPVEPREPEPEDLCCIMYTSGSTGNPKGVILSHKNIVAAVASANGLLGKYISYKNDTMMAYLPLAHVFEFVVENTCLFWGVTLGYASVRTLTDASVRNCKGDIKEFAPTFMIGVPAIWESIRKGILSKLQTSSPNAQALFTKAFNTKCWFLERGLSTPLLDRLVFSKIREQLGGRLKLAISGGAPLSLETQKFLTVTVCPILGGFGMTESCSVCSVMTPEQYGYGHVGAPGSSCEIKLVDVPEANYFSTNEKPQGEVWIRGPSVTKGYWKREDLTRETISDGGWLQTGDIAEWNENGTLTIIDRKKNLVKLSNGEYIALERLESIYKSCIYVNNICIYADSLLPRPVALIVPNEKEIKYLAGLKNIQEEDWDLLCQNSIIKQVVHKAVNEQAKIANLKPAEILFDIYLCAEEWTTENGMLTAAQKMKRKEVTEQYKTALNEMNKLQSV
ncbi:uncharacterized protein BX663DRAFT_481859 [Cokeromyces recurvatus]|uniref:uncharacterized protein n=1 Tax=Cokeromyces recurvatus TaxID=90255 RepID=UPI002220D58A|nr:uncharacterized protein BX663DRAFT_481859 [Cokeromyces recurvatus]KAI7907531.1 hypothetical protein BX663DRAFT_481859 [Cokeromyces recurvatus]